MSLFRVLVGLSVLSLALGGCAKRDHEREKRESTQVSTQAKDKPASDNENTAPPAATKVKPKSKLLDPSQWTATAPDKFAVVLETTKGDITIDVDRSASPLGADRLFNMVKAGYFEDIAIFRTLPNFVIQFGMHGDPEVNKVWASATFADDKPKGSNEKGTLVYAKTSQPNSRNTQLFINLADNARLDAMGFAPFGKVRSMDVVEKLNMEYGQQANQALISAKGNSYLKERFPNMDYIKSAKIL